jgi:putative acetyltransferase
MRYVFGGHLRIRPATNADRPRLFAIWRAAVKATHDFLAPADYDAIEAMVQRDYFPATAFTVAVDEGDMPLGFIEVEDATQIGALFVDPAHHGRGIGRALVEAAMPHDVPLTVEVNEANAAARAVYERWGFRVIGRHETDPQGRPYPLLVMRREASPSSGS